MSTSPPHNKIAPDLLAAGFGRLRQQVTIKAAGAESGPSDPQRTISAGDPA